MEKFAGNLQLGSELVKVSILPTQVIYFFGVSLGEFGD